MILKSNKNKNSELWVSKLWMAKTKQGVQRWVDEEYRSAIRKVDSTIQTCQLKYIHIAVMLIVERQIERRRSLEIIY